MKNHSSPRFLLLIAMLICLPVNIFSSNMPDSTVMNRIFNYASDVTIGDTIRTNIYIRYVQNVKRKNIFMMCVPSMYHAFRTSQQEFLGEEYAEVTFFANNKTSRKRNKRISTFKKDRSTLPVLLRYITPHIYQTTIIDDDLLSPFVSKNHSFYRYRLLKQYDGTTWVVFKPKIKNTQTVNGTAVVDTNSGKVLSAVINGEFDMVKFSLTITMPDEASPLPSSCFMDADFQFLGNKIHGYYRAFYGVDAPSLNLPDTQHDRAFFDAIRPDTLSEKEHQLYANSDSLRAIAKIKQDSLSHTNNQHDIAKDILWDAIGEKLINRTKGEFDHHRGTYRISPLLNPLYFGYSNRKGLYYKFNLRGGYQIRDNSNISLRVKAGYSFKQRQLYFTIPVTYVFNENRNGYVKVEVGNGNRIFNSTVLDRLKAESGDNVEWDAMNLDYFKDMHWSMMCHYDISNQFGIAIGYIFHKRTPVDKNSFVEAGKPLRYKSFAPMLELQYQPQFWPGLVLTLDYEMGLKNVMKSDGEYKRWEVDVSKICPLACRRSLSFRTGAGIFTSRSKGVYFLDYTNFREDNIRGGWNDDWTGEFELLNRNLYNASKYYIRGNMTYESPLLILSRIPIIGSVMEYERIYISGLRVSQIKNYVELGYGFTNRVFSAGAFISLKEWRYQSFGVRIGFELFDKW